VINICVGHMIVLVFKSTIRVSQGRDLVFSISLLLVCVVGWNVSLFAGWVRNVVWVHLLWVFPISLLLVCVLLGELFCCLRLG